MAVAVDDGMRCHRPDRDAFSASTHLPREMDASLRTGATTIAPSPDLARFVRRYRIVDLATNETMTIPASRRSFMIIHFGEELLATIDKTAILPGAALVSGPPTRPFTVRAIGGAFRFVAVEFTHVGLFAFFGDVASALVNAMVPLAELIPSAHRCSLAEAMTEISSEHRRIAEIEHMLRGLLKPRGNTALHHTSAFVATAAARPEQNVADLSRTLGVSRALLHRHVKRATGMSPKTLLGARRLNRALTSIYDGERRSLTELAHALDFFDLAHFDKAFKQFAGCAPSRLPRTSFMLARAMM